MFSLTLVFHGKCGIILKNVVAFIATKATQSLVENTAMLHICEELETILFCFWTPEWLAIRIWSLPEII